MRYATTCARLRTEDARTHTATWSLSGTPRTSPGVSHEQVYETARSLGYSPTQGHLNRKEIRAVLRHLLVRTKADVTKESIRTAIHVFADVPEPGEIDALLDAD
jgi:hypothetical protein